MPSTTTRGRTHAASRPAAAPASGFSLVRLVPSGRSLIVGFALVGIAVGLYVAARQTSVLAVQTIQVKGAPPSVAGRIRAALAPLQGTSLVRISLAAVAERLIPIPEVETVTIDRSFPHALEVTITTARRVAVLRVGRSAYLVSERGRILAEIPRQANPRLPRIWAPATTAPSVGGSLGDRRLLAAVQAATAVFRDGIGGLRVRFVRSGANELTYGLRNGIEVRLGTAAQLPLKLAIARRILSLAAGERYVDVSVPERPVAGSNSKVGD